MFDDPERGDRSAFMVGSIFSDERFNRSVDAEPHYLETFFRDRISEACDALVTAIRDGGPDLPLERFTAASHLLTSLCGQLSHHGALGERGRLRSYVDAGLSADVVRRIAEVAIEEAGVYGVTMLELITRLSNAAPSLRDIQLLLGRLLLQAGDHNEAIEAANVALRLNAVCPDSQRLLFDALTAKRRVEPKADHPDISMADVSDRFCLKPFTSLVTGYAGKSFLCDCPAYLPFESGNALEGRSANDLWNSPAAQEIRRSILDGDFSYCSRTLCGLLKEDLLPRRDDVTDPVLRDIIDNHTVYLDHGPQNVQLSHDQSCNLACPSCRNEIMTLKSSEQEPYNRSLNTVMLPMLESVRGTVMVSGGGDPFASKFYRSVLESLNERRFPDLRVAILTNGLLLTPKQWDALKPAHPMIGSIHVSVDAARPDTYADVRRPGNFARLLPNLEFLAERRKQGDFHLGLCFVVQRKNYAEMPEFVALGQRLGVDMIWFQRIVNFGSFTSQEIMDADVALATHPEHERFKEVLRHPLMSDPIVNLFGDFVAKASISPTEFATQQSELRDRRRIKSLAEMS
jgi:pyruvate-formate lyase-activating enzyme